MKKPLVILKSNLEDRDIYFGTTTKEFEMFRVSYLSKSKFYIEKDVLEIKSKTAADLAVKIAEKSGRKIEFEIGDKISTLYYPTLFEEIDLAFKKERYLSEFDDYRRYGLFVPGHVYTSLGKRFFLTVSVNDDKTSHRYIEDKPLVDEFVMALNNRYLVYEAEDFYLSNYKQWMIIENNSDYWNKFVFLKKELLGEYLAEREKQKMEEELLV